jgi:hypothetical protein
MGDPHDDQQAVRIIDPVPDENVLERDPIAGLELLEAGRTLIFTEFAAATNDRAL